MRFGRASVAIAALLLGAGASPPATPRTPRTPWLARYDLQHPTRLIALPRVLTEVSGLAVWDGAHVLAHQDERSVLFVIRLRDGRIDRTIDVGRRGGWPGDYEDLVLQGRHGFLAESGGAILEFTLDDTSTVVPARRHAERPGGACEVESLAADVARSGGGLVAVCKHARDDRKDGAMTMWRWQPGRGYAASPLLRVPWAAFDRRASAPPFAASGMARTADAAGWVLLDGPHARIAELSPDGRLLAVRALPKHLLPQAEGITFGADGTLYVASEGRRGAAVLSVYTPLR
jgi:hypothetical protein